ncbi:helix-turn-helix transcriptional regulator [Arsenicicoccus sp. oral taxon 190]|uniref:helix-turn-helix transcriptional regulator n=1 Tax=Arsenicicoccus sp. oral taxon 190 TaxID=1658671 RepID=UPI00067A2756|nr:helix-turn-helix transcriptional regulator [Arsenicicoccus sp. oral taxon 190]AKT52152.1 XRE family transcriptional regulator [Arsenicicoccus sp. oral taxon 190]
MASPTPRPVTRALGATGEALRGWRVLQGLTVGQVADRAGISERTVKRLEAGEGAALEHFLRVARALGLLDQVVAAVDPLQSDLGRMRADELLPRRPRRRPGGGPS